MSNQKNLSIAYYVSSHGYGHGVRSCNIIRAVNDLYPQLDVHIISCLSEGFFQSRIGSIRNPIRAQSFDIGMVQIDSIRVDVEATLVKVKQLYSQRKEIVSREAAYLKEQGIALIVSDIPALPLEAAALAGIPRLAVSNFGWDWIYSEFVPRDPRWTPIVDAIHEEYALTDLLLRLPFCEEMKAFPRIEDIPIVTAPGRNRRPEIAELTGCDPGKKWILLSFTTLDWNDAALANVEQIKDYEFFAVLPLAWEGSSIHPIDRERVPFSDVIASVDAVVSKPGFGILSDCIANQKPLVYSDRSDFQEYQILENAIRKYLKHVHIPAAKLYRGNLRESLDLLWEQPEATATLPLGGALIAAQRIAAFLA